MKIKECYISQNGISCITNINSLVNMDNINKNLNYNFKKNLKNNIIFFITLRSIEIFIKYITVNYKDLVNNNILDEKVLQQFIFS